MDVVAGMPLGSSMNEDLMSNVLKTGSTKKHYVQHFSTQPVINRPNAVDERDKASFYKDLYHFHDIKGTPIPRPPRVNGREIDLHKFYSLVCSRGGWAKINYRNEWEDLVPEFDLPSKCVNASVALKQIYMRFLDRYEKIHFLGEDNDRIADENDEDNRHKKWNNKHFNEVPLKYNYQQHNVADSMRATLKLSTNLYKASEYERLLMSLMSPLPNEQDFAVNVCTLMANESRHTLKIERCPKLLDALLAHSGVYSHHSMRDLFFEYYANVRKHSLQSFWKDCLHDKPDVLELTYEDFFGTDENASNNVSNRPPVRLRNDDNEAFEDGLNTRFNELNEFSSMDFLNLKRGLGTHDYIGQRVHQVTTICRNLSFFDENLPILVKNRSFIRFLVMCANIRWGNLHQMGLDTLGNIAIELDLCDPEQDNLTKCLLAAIAEGLESSDRGVIISCLEILYKLCQKGTNEDHLHKYLKKHIYRQICMYLSLNDIMLLLYTLECLFALSSMGEKACFAIVQVNGVIDTLVSLVSVEAQSYGPDGCILMRVVETIPTHLGTHHQNYQQQQQQPHQSTHVLAQPTMTQLQTQSPVQQHTQPPPPIDVTTTTTIETHPPAPQLQSPLPSPPPTIVQSTLPLTVPTQKAIMQPKIENDIKPNVIVNSVSANPIAVSSISITTNSPSMATSVPLFNSSNVVFSEQQTTTIHTNSQNQNSNKLAQEQENEQFALAWLRATFEPVSALASRIEQQDLYKMYLTACSKIGRTGVVSQYHFPRCVRNVFGGTVGPNQIKIKQNAMEISSYFYEGIRIRAQPLAVVHKGTILQAAVTTTTIKTSDNNGKKDQMTRNTIMVESKPNLNQSSTPTSAPILQHVLSGNQSGESIHISTNRTNIQTSTFNATSIQQNMPITSMYSTPIKRPMNSSSNSITVSSTPSIVSSSPSGTSSSSLIKAILANKVTADGQTITSNIIASANSSITTATTNMNVHQVAQRQHLQKQREAQLAAASAANTQMNVTNIGKDSKTTIVIKGGVPPNVKAAITGNSMIPATLIEKKAEAMIEAFKPNWDPVPPLAPLSSGSNTIRQQSNLPSVSPSKTDEDSNSTSQSACLDESEFAGFELLPGNEKFNDDNKDIVAGKQSHVVNANKMLADLLDRKSSDPPFHISGDINNKRKIEMSSMHTTNDEPLAKRSNQYMDHNDDINNDDGKNITKTSSSAANLYAKLAASLLEDEDMEGDEPITSQSQASVMSSSLVEQPKPVITVPVQRQIIVSPNNPPQMILAPTQSNQQIGQATATIKTESGFQTVPVILQHSNPNQMGNIQIQKQLTGMGQQIMQPVMQQQQTQYMLATNQQGQTYLVAQPQQPPVNQILLTQTSQQQGGAPTKTIIILQQQAPGPCNTVGTPQKVIMTTQQGQQMIVTQVPRPVQHHVIVNQQSMATSANVIQSNPQISTTNTFISHVNTGTVNSISYPQTVSQVQMHHTQSPQIRSQPTISQHQMNSMASTNMITTSDKKKVFVTGSGNIEVTQVSQPIAQSQNITPNISQQMTQQITVTTQSMPKPVSQLTTNTQQQMSSHQLQKPNITTTTPTIAPPPPQPILTIPNAIKPENDADLNWLYVCDWRGCQRKKFRSANEVYLHACAEHCPDNIDPNADIYCQWGPGPNLCDNLPRKRFSLMTHINDRHITLDSFKAAVQRRIAAGPQTTVTQPVTIIKKPVPPTSVGDNVIGSASPTLSTSSSSSVAGSSAAMQAIKRHTMDLVNPKELLDENEGPVTKSIRLTASLILRNLVNYTTTAKRCLRFYEPHLSGIALSNVESSRTIAQVLYEMNETRPY